MRVLKSENTPTRPGTWFAGADEVLGRGLERLETAAALVLHHHLEAAGIADAAHRRRLNHDDEGFLDRAKPRLQAGAHPLDGETLGDAVIERLHGHEDRAGVGRIGEGGAVEAGEGHRVSTPSVSRMILVALRTTASVRSSDAPGGSWITVMR